MRYPSNPLFTLSLYVALHIAPSTASEADPSSVPMVSSKTTFSFKSLDEPTAHLIIESFKHKQQIRGLEEQLQQVSSRTATLEQAIGKLMQENKDLRNQVAQLRPQPQTKPPQHDPSPRLHLSETSKKKIEAIFAKHSIQKSEASPPMELLTVVEQALPVIVAQILFST